MESLLGGLFNIIGNNGKSDGKVDKISEFEYKHVVYAREDWVRGKEITSAYVDNKQCVICVCSICYGFNPLDIIPENKQMHLRNYKNNHCIICTCKKCVCDKGRKDGRYSEEVVKPTKKCEENGKICLVCKRKGI